MRESVLVNELVTDYTIHLTRRECEIATLVATGASNKEIARQLTISAKTVKNLLTKVFAKTGARSRTELAVRVVKFQYAMLQ